MVLFKPSPGCKNINETLCPLQATVPQFVLPSLGLVFHALFLGQLRRMGNGGNGGIRLSKGDLATEPRNHRVAHRNSVWLLVVASLNARLDYYEGRSEMEQF